MNYILVKINKNNYGYNFAFLIEVRFKSIELILFAINDEIWSNKDLQNNLA